MTTPGRNNFLLVVRIITLMILISLAVIYYVYSERYIGWLVILTAVFYLFLIYTSKILSSIRSASNNRKAYRVIVTDIRPYMYEDTDKASKQGVTIIYTMASGKKGKVNLTESTFQERFPDLKVGEELIKTRDDSIPRRQ